MRSTLLFTAIASFGPIALAYSGGPVGGPVTYLHLDNANVDNSSTMYTDYSMNATTADNSSTLMNADNSALPMATDMGSNSSSMPMNSSMTIPMLSPNTTMVNNTVATATAVVVAAASPVVTGPKYLAIVYPYKPDPCGGDPETLCTYNTAAPIFYQSRCVSSCPDKTAVTYDGKRCQACKDRNAKTCTYGSSLSCYYGYELHTLGDSTGTLCYPIGQPALKYDSGYSGYGYDGCNDPGAFTCSFDGSRTIKPFNDLYIRPDGICDFK